MNSKKIELLRKLGAAIRDKGKKIRKQHGNQWELVLQSKIKFVHDDYNHAVHAYFPDGTDYYFGMDFGGFTGDHVSENHYLATIDLVLNEKA